MTIIGIYTPVEGKDSETLACHDKPQKIITNTNCNDHLIKAGDLKSRNGKCPVSGARRGRVDTLAKIHSKRPM